ncbi:hypothetical protein BJV77DRAFT_621272 [Russula vinacea]|nr:hypothetical protein BJV77DRAFT_621272 [Russula vinacea]
MYPSSTHEWYMQSLFFPDGVGWNLVGIPDFPAGRGFMDFVRRPGLAGSLNKHYSNGGPCFPSTPHWQSGDILHGSFLRSRYLARYGLLMVRSYLAWRHRPWLPHPAYPVTAHPRSRFPSCLVARDAVAGSTNARRAACSQAPFALRWLRLAILRRLNRIEG